MHPGAERYYFKESVSPSTSRSTLGTGVSRLSQGRLSSHSRTLSQPCHMPSMQSIMGRGYGHADASLYAGMPQVALKSPSEPAQSTPLPVPLNASLLSPPSHHQRSPESAPWSLRTRASGADTHHVENAQISMTLSSNFLENQSIHAPFLGHPGYSPATLSAQFPSADFTNMEPTLLPHTQDDSLSFMNLSPASGMQVDSASATLPAGSGYSGALSRRTLTQQATPLASPASPESQPTGQNFTGKRRRLSMPKDPRAAKRLRSQRQGDDENLEALYDLIVPRSAGVVQKKDRLGMSTLLLLPALTGCDDDDRVSSSLCEKADADTGRFKRAINFTGADERLSVHFALAARRVHGGLLILQV
jgi:hypothetical protein